MVNQQLQKLITELQQGNERQRRAASYKLGKSKDPTAVPALINAFNDPDGTVHQNVRDGLRNIGSQEALDFLNSNAAAPSASAASGGPKPSRPGTSSIQNATPHMTEENTAVKAPAPDVVVQKPTILLENSIWKIIRLGGVLGEEPIAIHADTQRVAVHHIVTGFLSSKVDFRVYSLENSFSYNSYPGVGSPRPRFSSSGEYILLPKDAISNAALPGWDVQGSLIKVNNNSVVGFRNHSTFAGGVRGTGYAEFSPNETLVALGNFHNSKVHIVDMDSLARPTSFLTDRDASIFIWDSELETSNDITGTSCLRWAPNASCLAHIVSAYGKSYFLILWRFTDGDRIDTLKKIHEIISRGEKVQPGQIDPNTMTKVKDSQTLKLKDFSGEVCFSPDSQYLAMGGGKATAVLIVDVTKMALIHEEPSTGTEIHALAFLRGGKYLIGSGKNGILYLWSVDFSAEGSKLILVEKTQISNKILHFSFSSQKPMGIVATNDIKGSVDIYQVDVLLE
jgi:hypothetical protein